MSDAIRRGTRTFIQAFLGSVITSGVLSSMSVEGVVDFDVLQKVGVSAAAAALIGFISWAQNALEDSKVVPEVIK